MGGHHLTGTPLFILALAALGPQRALELLLWKARLVVDKKGRDNVERCSWQAPWGQALTGALSESQLISQRHPGASGDSLTTTFNLIFNSRKNW